MRGSVKKDAAIVIVLLLIVCIVFKFLLMPVYAQQEMKNELPAATEQLEVSKD